MEWGDLFFELCCEKVDDGYFARFEIHPFGIVSPTASELIEAFCQSVTQLDDCNRDLWDRAHARVIDLGYEGANNYRALHDLIPHTALQKMMELKINLALTFYPENLA